MAPPTLGPYQTCLALHFPYVPPRVPHASPGLPFSGKPLLDRARLAISVTADWGYGPGLAFLGSRASTLLRRQSGAHSGLPHTLLACGPLALRVTASSFLLSFPPQGQGWTTIIFQPLLLPQASAVSTKSWALGAPRRNRTFRGTFFSTPVGLLSAVSIFPTQLSPSAHPAQQSFIETLPAFLSKSQAHLLSADEEAFIGLHAPSTQDLCP